MGRLTLAALIVASIGVAVLNTVGAKPQVRVEEMAFAQTIPEVDPQPYWEVRGCDHGHAWKSAKRGARHLLRHHQPVVNKAKVRHYKRCTQTPKQSRRVQRFVKASWEWRRSYEHKWVIKFNSLPYWQRAWAVSTSSCESGMNPTTETGNGFVGAFQFLPSTWRAAGGEGWPSQHSWHYQAWIAVHWMLRVGTSPWPVCG